MANITPYTNQIRTARYGEEVRGSIVNALEAMNTDINNDTASARSYANAASANATTCQSISDNLQSVIQSVEQTEATIEAAETQRQEAEATRQATETGYVAQCRNYAERAENAVLRYGVTQFNGRTGSVVPANGDYSSDMITHGVGGSVSGKFDSVDSAIAANADAISTNADAISTNADNIASNTNAITGLQTITNGSGTIGSDTNIANATLRRCTFLKFGNVVFVNLMLYTNNSSALLPKDTTLFTAPAGFRPAGTTMLSGTCSSGGSTQSTLFNVFANGEIHQLNFNNCAMVQLSAIYSV